MFKFEFTEIPSDKTTQGEFPSDVITKKASPIPNKVNPKINIRKRCRLCFPLSSPQVVSARQDVLGIVFEGLRKFRTENNQFSLLLVSLTAKLYLNYHKKDGKS